MEKMSMSMKLGYVLLGAVFVGTLVWIFWPESKVDLPQSQSNDTQPTPSKNQAVISDDEVSLSDVDGNLIEETVVNFLNKTGNYGVIYDDETYASISKVLWGQQNESTYLSPVDAYSSVRDLLMEGSSLVNDSIEENYDYMFEDGIEQSVDNIVVQIPDEGRKVTINGERGTLVEVEGTFDLTHTIYEFMARGEGGIDAFEPTIDSYLDQNFTMSLIGKDRTWFVYDFKSDVTEMFALGKKSTGSSKDFTTFYGEPIYPVGDEGGIE